VTDPLVGRDTLLDAGPLIALLVRRDQWHTAVTAVWPDTVHRCITTEPVIVEAAHAVQRYGGHPARVLEFLISSELPVFALHLPLHERCVELMHRYADLPMDYADATLVALGDRLRLKRVFTTDRKGFRTYRGSRGLTLEVVPLAPG
jgi:predicted nucleic acid-binding protein